MDLTGVAGSQFAVEHTNAFHGSLKLNLPTNKIPLEQEKLHRHSLLLRPPPAPVAAALLECLGCCCRLLHVLIAIQINFPGNKAPGADGIPARSIWLVRERGDFMDFWN